MIKKKRRTKDFAPIDTQSSHNNTSEGARYVTALTFSDSSSDYNRTIRYNKQRLFQN